ncbi:HPr family phosphocarrier protein [Bremerella cremea]|uniref:HPr family phosphocarrier protein n=2 Tax=Bremerella cremea TaxID=1031537 RepID=A0A368KUN3_9BACT|nr:HPr family phosphocarrier protein [Bremerella cremea]
MHLIPCSNLVHLTKDFPGDVRLSKGEQDASCKSILELLVLFAEPETTLTLTVTGEQAEEMAEKVSQFFSNGCILPPP